MSGEEGLCYLDISTPEQFAIARQIAKQVRRHDQLMVAEVASLLEEGILLDPDDVQRIRDALAVYDYQQEVHLRLLRWRDNAAWLEGRALSDEEWEQRLWEEFGPDGPSPPDDAPLAVREHAIRRRYEVKQLQECRALNRIVPFRLASSEHAVDSVPSSSQRSDKASTRSDEGEQLD